MDVCTGDAAPPVAHAQLNSGPRGNRDHRASNIFKGRPAPTDAPE
eukprot:CAMPEP_0175468916 /NCGR_PEP_ID=MMETSP0095-20121207/72071_1 /TAXON_ID=311494 /ORGANISM="Alexandrium monilatum, Strain CCMP3105" /LENGTH=44 /DNA_ID= /DNA_START= /DNA_END= /DNA_ORIENTATION=